MSLVVKFWSGKNGGIFTAEEKKNQTQKMPLLFSLWPFLKKQHYGEEEKH